MQFGGAVRGGRHIGIVSRHHCIESKVDRLVEQSREFDALVTAHARVRGATGRVFGDEVVDHGFGELLGKVPDVKRDTEQPGRATCIQRIFDRAATARPGAKQTRHSGQSQVHPGHVVTRFDGTRGGDGGVDSPAHRSQNLHASSLDCSRKPLFRLVAQVFAHHNPSPPPVFSHNSAVLALIGGRRQVCVKKQEFPAGVCEKTGGERVGSGRRRRLAGGAGDDSR